MARRLFAVAWAFLLPTAAAAQPPAWYGYAGNPQHTAVSPVASQPLQAVHWSAPMDLDPQFGGGGSYLLTHYGSPAITANNTLIMPVKTGATNGFRIEGRSGTTGTLLWTQNTDYLFPPHNIWIPSYGPGLAPGNKLYFPGAGGTVYTRGNLDAPGAVTPTQLAFYGMGTYNANPSVYNDNVRISTPISSDAAGNIYFGYHVVNPTAVGGLQSGLAKITPAGVATYVSAASLAPPAGGQAIQTVAMNCAPAITADGTNVYIAVSSANGTDTHSGRGYLVALNASNLSFAGRAELRDVKTPANWASLNNSGSGAPMIGPDGDVYYGVLRNSDPFSQRGWMLHFSGDLATSKTAASFGWDSTASLVPASMVPQYTGSSEYLIFTKYNNYSNNQNKIAVLDPNDIQDDPIDPEVGPFVMKEILTKLSPSPYGASGFTEWCINTAVVDPATDSILVNNADGKLYRWHLPTNTLSEVITLTDGILEAYTPTFMGPDGTVYAINDTILFAVGTPVPEPASILGLVAAIAALGAGVRRVRRARVSAPSSPGG